MLGFTKRSIIGDQTKITLDGIYNISGSTFMGIALTSASSYGACIVINCAIATLNVKLSTFLVNTADDFAAGIGVLRCYNTSLTNLCFVKNRASKSPDIYMYNYDGYVTSFYISDVSLYGSMGVYYGLTLAAYNPSSMKYVNQSNCIFSQGNLGIYFFISAMLQ